jgi:hypothetical protein
METFRSAAILGKAAKYISVENGPMPCKAPKSRIMVRSCFFVMNGLFLKPTAVL